MTHEPGNEVERGTRKYNAVGNLAEAINQYKRIKKHAVIKVKPGRGARGPLFTRQGKPSRMNACSKATRDI
jgi:hypothetical protein